MPEENNPVARILANIGKLVPPIKEGDKGAEQDFEGFLEAMLRTRLLAFAGTKMTPIVEAQMVCSAIETVEAARRNYGVRVRAPQVALGKCNYDDTEAHLVIRPSGWTGNVHLDCGCGWNFLGEHVIRIPGVRHVQG